jgi:DNA-binding NtrC family response regulator
MVDMALPIVLFVDGDASILIALTRALRRDCIDIRATTSPHEALEIAMNEEVAVFVYDWLLPEMSGTELAQRIRCLRPNVELILSSGAGDSDGNAVFAMVSKASPIGGMRAAVSGAIECYYSRECRRTG